MRSVISISAITVSGRSKIEAVKEVEHLHAELDGDTFAEICILEEREIDVGVPRAVQVIPRATSELAIQRWRKRSRRPIDVKAGCVGALHIFGDASIWICSRHFVGPFGILSCSASPGITRENGKGLTSMQIN